MKHTVTELNDPNEPIMFSNSILGNYCFDTFFGEFEAKTCYVIESYSWSEVIHSTQSIELNCTIVDKNITNFIEFESTDVVLDTILWNLYFNGSNFIEGEGVGSILTNMKGIES